MTGELIATGVTFGAGRKAINSAFSGTAQFNNVVLDSGGNLSAGTGGGTITSGGTDLYNIFLTAADGNDITRVQPGTNMSTGGTGTLPVISLLDDIILNSISATTISAQTINLTTLRGFNNPSVGSYDPITVEDGIYMSAWANFSGGNGNGVIYSANTDLYTIFSTTGGNLWSASTGVNAIIPNNGSGNNAGATNSSILAGSTNSIDPSSFRSSILAGSGITATIEDTAYTQRLYTDEYIDYNPQTTLPSAVAGRMFFSGGSLNRIMYNTGGTASDWIII